MVSISDHLQDCLARCESSELSVDFSTLFDAKNHPAPSCGVKDIVRLVKGEDPEAVAGIADAGDMAIAIKLSSLWALGRMDASSPYARLKHVLTEEPFKAIVASAGGLDAHVRHSAKYCSHIARLTNPYAEMPVFDRRVPHKTRGITQFDQVFGRPTYSVGNSADMPYQRAFSLVVCYQDRYSSLAQLILAGDPLMQEAMLSLGVSQQSWDNLLLIDNHANDAIPPALEQVLWPCYSEDGEDCEFIAISPMPSAQVYASIRHEMRRFNDRHPDRKPPSHRIPCGGLKPQNAGAAVVSFGGKLPGLYAASPKQRPAF